MSGVAATHVNVWCMHARAAVKPEETLTHLPHIIPFPAPLALQGVTVVLSKAPVLSNLANACQ